MNRSGEIHYKDEGGLEGEDTEWCRNGELALRIEALSEEPLRAPNIATSSRSDQTQTSNLRHPLQVLWNQRVVGRG